MEQFETIQDWGWSWEEIADYALDWAAKAVAGVPQAVEKE